MRFNIRLSILFMSAILLVACGGGGGGPNVKPTPTPTPTPGSSYDYTEGTKSSEKNADDAFQKLKWWDKSADGSGRKFKTIQETYNKGKDASPTIDTQARDAWKLGWTGKGVKVGVVDRFARDDMRDHGGKVSFVVSAVAPEVTVITKHSENLSSAAAAWKDLERQGVSVINNSFEFSHYNSNFKSLIQKTIDAYDPTADSYKKALYVFAAGNWGDKTRPLYCATARLENCNNFAAVIDGLRKKGVSVGDSTIFVGALKKDTDELADFSIRAGNLKNDFIVAKDSVLFKTDGQSGTSYASPRVVGAAALVKHKFPNLTSPQIKQVLLQTATDLGASGVDEVYGHGKLNILGTLSPRGKVSPK